LPPNVETFTRSIFSSNGFIAGDCAVIETARARLTQTANVRIGILIFEVVGFSDAGQDATRRHEPK
jgi:hypothetical protein